MPQILELQKHFKHLELKFMRGNPAQVAEFMKSGDAELAIASSLGEAWDRLDHWPLFSESFILVASEWPSTGRLVDRSASLTCAKNLFSCARLANISEALASLLRMQRPQRRSRP